MRPALEGWQLSLLCGKWLLAISLHPPASPRCVLLHGPGVAFLPSTRAATLLLPTRSCMLRLTYSYCFSCCRSFLADRHDLWDVPVPAGAPPHLTWGVLAFRTFESGAAAAQRLGQTGLEEGGGECDVPQQGCLGDAAVVAMPGCCRG